MRKRTKNKSPSCCALCKPHKRGWCNRWKPKEWQKLLEFEQEKKELPTTETRKETDEVLS